MQIVKSEGKWIADFPDQDFNWSQLYTMALKGTIDLKNGKRKVQECQLHAFQYKYLLRILPNNKFLFKCKIPPSVLCDFCSMHEEGNAHLFWECWYVHDF